MLCKSPIAKMVHAVSCVIVALNAINTGLYPMDYDFYSSGFVMNNLLGMLNMIYYIVGIAGIVCLASFVMCVINGKSHCETSNPRMCSRCGSMSGCNCR